MVVLKRQRELNLSRLVIKTADDSRVSELTCFHVIHVHTIDVHIIKFLIKSTIPEACRREEKSYLASIEVVVRVDECHVLRHSFILIQLCLSESERRLICGDGCLLVCVRCCLRILCKTKRTAAESNHC